VACARRGWTFLSGDATQLVRRSNDGMITGRPFAIRFREGARLLFPELAAYVAKRGLNGKMDIEPPVEDLNIATSMQARASHIVFLDCTPGADPATLCPVSQEEAFRRMARVIFFGDDELRNEQRAALARFIKGRPTLELKYSDAAEAERLLRASVRGNG